jgi:hypothetical protein
MTYPFYSFPSDHETGTYESGQVTVGSTATLIGNFGYNQSGVLINNSSSEIVYLGGSGVTSTTGLPLPVSSTIVIPTNGGVINSLYGITSTSTSKVSYLIPSAGGATNIA